MTDVRLSWLALSPAPKKNVQVSWLALAPAPKSNVQVSWLALSPAPKSNVQVSWLALAPAPKSNAQVSWLALSPAPAKNVQVSWLALSAGNIAAINSAVIADYALGSEAIQVQHDLTGLLPTGSGQRNFKLSKVAAAVKETVQPTAQSVRTFKASSIELPQTFSARAASGATDTGRAVDAASVSIEAGWQDKAIAVDSLALSIESAWHDQAAGSGSADVATDGGMDDAAHGLSSMSISRQLAPHVLQTQALYVMGFYG